MNELITKQRLGIIIAFIIQLGLILLALILSFLIPSFNYFYLIIFVIGFAGIVFNFTYATIFNVKMSNKKKQTELLSGAAIGNELDSAYQLGKVGLAVCDSLDNVVWINDFLVDRIPNLLDKNIIKDYFPDLSKLKEQDKQKHVTITFEDYSYYVYYLQESNIFIFRDMSDYEELSNYTKEQAPVVGYIEIDNYDEIQFATNDQNKFEEMVSDVRTIIVKFGDQFNCLLRKLSDYSYIFITSKENFDQMEKDKFSIMNQVHKLSENNGLRLSIGVAYGFPDFDKLSDSANGALEAALSRGGDQIAITGFNENMRWIGGKSEANTSINRVKYRELSNFLSNVVTSYKNIIIMPHNYADFDAIGSALGIYFFCKNTKDCNATIKICWETKQIENKCRLAVETLFDEKEMSDIFANMRLASSMIKDDGLIIAVDHSNPQLAIFRDCVNNQTDNICVIDHHRPTASIYENDLLAYRCIDTASSSASELVTFLIDYGNKNVLNDSKIATMLLAGITMDTKNFRDKTSKSTFDAASYLKNCGASSKKVNDYQKEDLDDYNDLISLFLNNELYDSDTMIIKAKDEEEYDDTTISKVANMAIQLRGVSVSFCIGRINDKIIKISLRSDGSVNVEKIALSLGGGGHLTMAAITLPNQIITDTDLTTDKVKTLLVNKLDDLLDDCRIDNNMEN